MILKFSVYVQQHLKVKRHCLQNECTDKVFQIRPLLSLMDHPDHKFLPDHDSVRWGYLKESWENLDVWRQKGDLLNYGCLCVMCMCVMCFLLQFSVFLTPVATWKESQEEQRASTVLSENPVLLSAKSKAKMLVLQTYYVILLTHSILGIFQLWLRFRSLNNSINNYFYLEWC